MTQDPWRVVGASVVGASHLERAVPCQDAHHYRVLAGGELLVAVADGAGSAARAEVGASRAVATAIEKLAQSLPELDTTEGETGWKRLMAQVFESVRVELDAVAQLENRPLRDFATTLTVAVVTAEWTVVGQLGDGAAVAQIASGRLKLTVTPQRGEYANEAYFVTLVNALENVTVCTWREQVMALVMMTDGLLRLALQLPTYEPYGPFIEPLLAFTAQQRDEAQARERLAGVLASARICDRTDDDKTLVIAVRSATDSRPSTAETIPTPEPGASAQDTI